MKKIAQKIKTKKSINVNNLLRNELPFNEKEIFHILKIVDIALADEKIESEIKDWFKLLYDPITEEETEQLHKKINLFLQEK